MTLYLVRHGHAVAGVDHADPGLDELGVAQATCVADALGSVQAKHIVSSPLKRARQTAEPTSARLRLPVEMDSSVSEVFDSSMKTSERRVFIGRLLGERWEKQSSDLRSWRQAVLDTLTRLAADECIVFSHFVAIAAALGHAMGDDRVAPIYLANGSISKLRLSAGRLVADTWGTTEHLAALGSMPHQTPLPGKT